MSRRSFIGTVAALAALAVTPSLAKLPQSDMERLLAMIRTGLVMDQTFHLDAPITINFPVVIVNCKFIFSCALDGISMPMPLLNFGKDALNSVVTGCYFVGKHSNHLINVT